MKLSKAQRSALLGMFPFGFSYGPYDGREAAHWRRTVRSLRARGLVFLSAAASGQWRADITDVGVQAALSAVSAETAAYYRSIVAAYCAEVPRTDEQRDRQTFLAECFGLDRATEAV